MDRVCPLLALAADHRTAVDGVDAGHRCHATDEPIPLERQLQAQLCLTPRHDHCERYLQHVARRGAAPGSLAAGDGLVSTRMLLAPEPAWRGIAGRARPGRPGRTVAVGAGLLLAGVGGVTLAGPALNGGLTMLEAAEVSSPAATATTLATLAPATAGARATATATQLPTPTPSPTAEPPTPTPEPTPLPTPQPTPPPPTATPAPAQTYVVQEGDTLAEIAQRFGTSVQALQAANGIEDPNEILIGDVLLIP